MSIEYMITKRTTRHKRALTVNPPVHSASHY